jgi:hypothetical protein
LRGPLNCPVGLSSPAPPPDAGFEVVTIASLEAALAKLNIDVSVKDITRVIRELEEAKRARLIAQATEPRSERKSSLLLFVYSPLTRPIC